MADEGRSAATRSIRITVPSSTRSSRPSAAALPNAWPTLGECAAGNPNGLVGIPPRGGGRRRGTRRPARRRSHLCAGTPGSSKPVACDRRRTVLPMALRCRRTTPAAWRTVQRDNGSEARYNSVLGLWWGRPVVRDQPSYQGFFISQGLHGNRDHAVISTRRSAAEEGSLDFHLDGGQPIIPRAIDPLSRAPLRGTRGVDPHGDSRRRPVPPGETSGGRGRCCHRCRRCRPVPFRPG